MTQYLPLTLKNTVQMKELWQLCFPEDDESFLNWFFSAVFYGGMGAFVEGNLVSMALTKKVELALRAERVPSYLIRGVCTAPDYRGKHIGSNVMEKLMERAYHEGIGACVLVTDIPEFYERIGFCAYCWQGVRQFSTADKGEYSTSVTPHSMARIYHAFMQKKSGFILRDENTYSELLTDWVVYSGAKLICAKKGMLDVGYAAGTCKNGVFCTIEAVLPNDYALLCVRHAAKDMGCSKVEIPTCDKKTETAAMLYIVNPSLLNQPALCADMPLIERAYIAAGGAGRGLSEIPRAFFELY